MSRRRVLVGLGTAIAGTGLVSTGALTDVSADRGVSVATADGETALLGLVGQGPVRKNKQRTMVELTNNADDDMEITVELENCGDGTLSGTRGNEAGCGDNGLMFTLVSDDNEVVSIDATTTGTIPYTVTATTPDLTIETARTVESQSGKVKSAIQIKKPKKNDFTASAGNGGSDSSFTVNVKIEGDNTLTNIEYRVRDESGELVASDSEPLSTSTYDEKNIDVPVDSDASISAGTTYTLTVIVEDDSNNTASATVEDTA